MRKLNFICLFISFTLSIINSTQANIIDEKQEAIEKTRQIISGIINDSYSEIKIKKIEIKTFESDKNYFKARFSYSRFLTFQKMRHIIYVNPKVFKLKTSENAIRSILAHELAHVLYYTEKNRFELIGLISLTSGEFTAQFERKADLEAIKRGYGEGLIEYRNWLYQNIPNNDIKSKKRNYFSPDEIKLILKIIKDKPQMFKIWRKKIPKNIYEIKKSNE